MNREYPIRQKNIEERFWSKVRILDSDSCWEWMGSKVNKQDTYGQIRLNGRCHRAHRFAYQLIHKIQLNPKQFVCHTCDNPSCVNPKHLWIGTNSDNMQDSIRKGRHSPMFTVGGPNPQKNLTHCRRGHPFDEKNTHISKQKEWRCRLCRAAAFRKRYWKKKEVLAKLEGK